MIRLLPNTDELKQLISKHGEIWGILSPIRDGKLKILDTQHGKEIISVDPKDVEYIKD